MAAGPGSLTARIAAPSSPARCAPPSWIRPAKSANRPAATYDAFDSADDASAAEPTFDEELPRRLGELFEQWGGRRVSVDVYEVVADERR